MNILASSGNQQRQPAYRVQTIIAREKERVIVLKKTLAKEAIPHLAEIADALTGKHPVLHAPKLLKRSSTHLTLAYIPGPTWLAELETAVYDMNNSTQHLIWKKHRNLLQQLSISFPSDDQLQHVRDFFHNPSLDAADWINPGFLDLNLDNLKYLKRTYLIDWEFVYPFPLPTRYVQWRALVYAAHALQDLIRPRVSAAYRVVELQSHIYVPECWITELFSRRELALFLSMEQAVQERVTYFPTGYLTQHEEALRLQLSPTEQLSPKYLADQPELYQSLTRAVKHYQEIQSLHRQYSATTLGKLLLSKSVKLPLTSIHEVSFPAVIDHMTSYLTSASLELNRQIARFKRYHSFKMFRK